MKKRDVILFIIGLILVAIYIVTSYQDQTLENDIVDNLSQEEREILMRNMIESQIILVCSEILKENESCVDMKNEGSRDLCNYCVAVRESDKSLCNTIKEESIWKDRCLNKTE